MGEERFLQEAIKAGVKNAEDKTKKFRAKMELLKAQSETFSRPSLVDKHYLIQNQTPVCWRRYNNFLTCLNSKGSVEKCPDERFLAYFTCPKTWIDEWREQREEGGFPGVQAPLEPEPEVPEEEESEDEDDDDDDDSDDE